MKGIAIYMEGGGTGSGTRAALRQGMAEFLAELKDRVREISWSWKLVCCGSRDNAYRAFMAACQSQPEVIVILLVDAEGSVENSPGHHLAARDNWDLSTVNENNVHLMVQAMETWFVADPHTLTAYYGHCFRRNVFPRRDNLEEEEIKTILKALNKATRPTQKGQYHKTKHASDLLKLINPDTVRKRCPNCARLFDTLGRLITEAQPN